MNGIRLGTKLVRMLVKDRVQYPDRLAADLVSNAARCGLLLLLYAKVFALKGGTIQGTTFLVASWSVFFYFSLSSLRLRDVGRMIMQDVWSGNVEVLFSKPISYLAYRWWWQVGAGLYSFVVVSVVGLVILILTVGVPDMVRWPFFIPIYLVVFAGAMILSLLVYSLVGLTAFWVEDSKPIFWIVDKSVMILGGSYLPVALFPPFLYLLAKYSPFGASQFVSHTVYPSWQSSWYQFVGIQVLWLVVLGALAGLMFSRAKSKLSVNGG